MKHYLDKMVQELREEIDRDILGKLEDMLKCTMHDICNCDNVNCKKELKERIDSWDVMEVLDK